MGDTGLQPLDLFINGTTPIARTEATYAVCLYGRFSVVSTIRSIVIGVEAIIVATAVRV